MKANMVNYVKEYLDIDEETILKNRDIILESLFYKKQMEMQSKAENSTDPVFESYANVFSVDLDDIAIPLYDVLNCKPRRSVKYPGNRTYAVCLTHDIDDICPTWQHTLLSMGHCLKHFKPGDFYNQLSWRFKGKNHSPYMNFKDIMELEERYGARSTFFFMASEKDPVRFRYHIEDVTAEIREIVDSGWEVGLHGGYYAYNDPFEILREKRRLEEVLGKKVIGYRNHYLRFKIPETWQHLAQAGFKYDATFGYNNAVGYRNGLAHPFKPYDLSVDREIDILEIPLNIMDSALLNIEKSFREAWSITKDLMDKTEKYNGVLCVLWHNNSFNSPYKCGYEKFYEKILEYGLQRNAWMTSGEEIWRWWKHGNRDN